MYYILNETNQIIAADDTLLTLCGVAHINVLLTNIAKGHTDFDLTSDEQLTIEATNFTVKKSPLSSLLGNLTLVELIEESNAKEVFNAPIVEENEENDISSFLDTPKEEETLTEESVSQVLLDKEHSILEDDEDEITFSDHLSMDDILETPEEKKDEETFETTVLDDSELFDLISDTNDDSVSDTPANEEIKKEENSLDISFDDNDVLFEDVSQITETSEIAIDVDAISQKIGISSDDYNHFLNEFIDTALNLEKDLQTEEKRDDAVNTLTYLSKVLHLPAIGEIITSLGSTNGEKQVQAIESFYGTLSRITTHNELDTNEIVKETNISLEVQEDELTILDDPLESPKEEKLELFEELEEKEAVEVSPVEKAPSANSFGTIDLSDVKSKHFDFQLEEAANDLSLPVELIEEFVHDFIDQAHIETKKMLEAYEQGDLDTIQKIGHLLKGASSNLRINPLSDTLYQIQFCEDPSKLEMFIKDYWAHFLSFENQINVISN
jgi:uncharacterized protein (DUF1697 family)